MDEQRLDQLLDDAATTYRTDAPAPGDALWARIEAEAFDAPMMARSESGAPRRAPWPMIGGLVAASLMLGVAIGRFSTRGAAPLPDRAVASAPIVNDQYHQETEEFLGKTAVLLASLPADNGAGDAASAQLVSQAGQLLTTTRLMMDSPVGSDQRMRQLLQDLELVLAQVARLQPQRQRTEMQFISSALEQRDLVPRLRSAVADLAAGDH
jgi:hypothetical protein